MTRRVPRFRLQAVGLVATLIGCGGDPESTLVPAVGPSGTGGSTSSGNATGTTSGIGGAAGGGGLGGANIGGAGRAAGGSGPGGSGMSLGTGDEECEGEYGADVYDPYPNPGSSYPMGPASSSFGWVGDDFDSYVDGALIESSSNKAAEHHLDVTSGALYANYVSSYRRGWTTTYNFRVLAVGTQGGQRKRWTDQVAQYRGHIWSWHASPSTTAGMHVFARYQTENDLYVASLRYDGKVTIKRKHCDAYTTLASATLGPVEVKAWYTLRFSVVGNMLRFFVNGDEKLSVTDDVLSWGTTGIRTDHMDVYLDDWRLVY